MRAVIRTLALTAAVAVLTSACGFMDRVRGERTTSPENAPGVLRVALVSDLDAGLDPQQEYSSVGWEFLRCCLVRTLMSYDLDGADGIELAPDLAAQRPKISRNGRTWTFRLRRGLKYAPPLQKRTITAGDIVQALERAANPKTSSGYVPYYSVIKGFDDYAEGKAKRISGLSTPDQFTLQVELTRRTPDLGHRLALPATAPIPKGVTLGHNDDYAQFLVASGPYMFEGAEQLDFSRPSAEQDPVAGYSLGEWFTLVRNPSWDPASDPLRPAKVERIEVTIGGGVGGIARKVDQGLFDIGLDGGNTIAQIHRYQRDGRLAKRLFSTPSNSIRYMSFNLALPPFDDVHVRRAVNYLIDKDAIRRLQGGKIAGSVATHVIVDQLTGGRLKDYDRYSTDGHKGNLAKAKLEMRRSKYDKDDDGICDGVICEELLAVTSSVQPYPEQAGVIAEALQRIGIHLRLVYKPTEVMYDWCNTPSKQVALCLGAGWSGDYPDPYAFARPLFSRESIGPVGCCNFSLVGAGAKQLSELSYSTTKVPSAEAGITACDRTSKKKKALKCWVKLDRYLMEKVVPWVPLLFENKIDVVSARVSGYRFNPFTGVMALDHVTVGAPPASPGG